MTSDIHNKFNLDVADFHFNIFNNIEEGVYLIRLSDGVIIYANILLEHIFGYDKGEMIGQQVSIINASTNTECVDTIKNINEQIINFGAWYGDIHNIKNMEVSVGVLVL